MNTNSLKRFAKDARIKLLDQVGRKLEFVLTHDTAELRGKEPEITVLKNKITEHGKQQVIETVAYTWFNRFMALRFMDANGYTIPKVVTPLPGMSNPEILQNALGGNIDPALQIDRKRLNDLLDGKTAATNAHTEAYKMLLVASCNEWHTAMPFMFERISDYTELLLPDDLLGDYSIVADIRNGMSHEDCVQEEILGWLYQFYISDENEKLIQSKKPYKKDEIAPATQLFTPKWMVRYMVDNTLGQLWSELNPNTTIMDKLEFYIKPEKKTLATRSEKKPIEEIKFFDPCVGSGHILSYAFDVFFLLYEEQGYNTTEIPELIINRNLFGVDIDERATQIASFVMLMKGRRKNNRFLKKSTLPNITFFEDFEDDVNFSNGKVLGSLVKVKSDEIARIKIEGGSLFAKTEHKLIFLYKLLGHRYDCVVTNPPYLSSSRMEISLKTYVENNFKEYKSDLFSVFLIRCLNLTVEKGFVGYVCPYVWMFIKSYEKLRNAIITKTSIASLIQLEYNAFGPAVVPICTFVIENAIDELRKGIYISLSKFKGVENQAPRTLEAIKNTLCQWRFTVNQLNFMKVPETPLLYNVGERIFELFDKHKKIADHGDVKVGLFTCNNDMFLKFWHEVPFDMIRFNNGDISKIWVPHTKGGRFKKWYGNLDYVVNYDGEGRVISEYRESKGQSFSLPGSEKYFKPGITWSHTSSSAFSARFVPPGFIHNVEAPTLFDTKLPLHFLGFLNSKVATTLLTVLNPTMHFLTSNVLSLPYLPINDSVYINELVEKLVQITKMDYDAKETSWDFQINELTKTKNKKIEENVKSVSKGYDEMIELVRSAEQELNKYFIEHYKLNNELTPDVPLEEITIMQEEADIEDGEFVINPIPIVIQLISYATGCIFGRYSPDKPGIILANQNETLLEFLKLVQSPTFIPDEDNIIPVLEGEWFTDDIIGRFKHFLKVVFGEEHFEQNLRYIEDTLGKDIRKYFVKDFYNDHIKRYKKRPIYWMFSSPKGHFKALIYMHRYQLDLCSKLLNDYLQTFIGKLEVKRQSETRFSLREDISAREKLAAIKEIDKLEAMIKDCRDYEKTLFVIATQKIRIDLNDGVKVNYQKFKDVLVPIKEFDKEED